MAKKLNEAQEPSGSVAVEEVQEVLPTEAAEVKEPDPIVVQEPEVIPGTFYSEMLRSFQKALGDQAKEQAKFFLKAIEEIRKPVHDPIKEAQQARAKETQRQGQEAYWRQLEQRADACTHLREDMTSAIAWAQQSDSYADYPQLCKQMGLSGAATVANLVRGHCQHCQTKFSPIREECVSEKVWQRYGDLRRIPTQRGSGVLYVNS